MGKTDRDETLRLVVEAARHAPSVHNTQPWRFEPTAEGFDLHADLSRQLLVLDRDGRQLHLSCGAALFHARVAARALGLEATCTLLPDPDSPDLLARVSLLQGRAASGEQAALAAAILHRHTFRGTFSGAPVPDRVVDRLRDAAEAEGAVLVHVRRPDDLVALEVLLSRANAAEERSEAYRDELQQWVQGEAERDDGLSVALIDVAAGSSLRQRDFTLTHPDRTDGSAPPVDHPVVLIIATRSDDRLSWLRAGQAFAAVVLRAADQDIQAQPLGQVTDEITYRTQLGVALSMQTTPQLVLRMGYAPSRAGTPRRALSDVLSRSVGG